METRNCQNCKADFLIEQEDFDFYSKISVPAPTFCPECRMIRRMVFQNERSFYKRECDLCKKVKLMTLPSSVVFPVYCTTCWWGDGWDPSAYGKEYDFSRPFFDQYKELSDSVPSIGLNNILSTMVNSEYCSISSYLKNCYLCYNSDYDEDCMYSTYLEKSKFCLDMSMSMSCEMCYTSINLFKCFKVFFSDRCNESMNVWFSRDLDGCSDCFGCINLKNKQYYIFNEPYTKETYFAKLAEWNLGSSDALAELAERTHQVHTRHPRRYMEGLKNNVVSGDYIFNSKNTHLSFEVLAAEDSKYCQLLIMEGTKDSYDYTMWGMNATRLYECMGAGNNSSDLRFVVESWSPSSNLQYCRNIYTSCNDLFGCIGLKNAQYCILNKQYTKEEYESMIPRIVEHMNTMPYIDSKGKEYRYGEFLPFEFSLYGYNESTAQKYFPLTKEEAIEKGYNWQDLTEKNHLITKKNTEIEDTIHEVSDHVLRETIECGHKGDCTDQCTGAFRITKEELEFYRINNLPLPKLCPNCRYYTLIHKRYPIRYYNRKCQCAGASDNLLYTNSEVHSHGDTPCENTFITTFPADSKEFVYCEECYQKEVL